MNGRDIHSFTLVELLVVVAIIGVLTALLLPSLRNAKLQAQATACLSNQRQLGVAAFSYAGDWNTFVPVHSHAYWRDDLSPYIGKYPVFDCPAAVARIRITVSKLGTKDYTQSNSGSIGQFYALYSYRYSRYVPELGQVRSDNGAVRWWPPERGWRYPNNSIYAADCYGGRDALKYPSDQDATGNGGTNHIHADRVGQPAYFQASSMSDYIRRFADRHLGTNCLFLDGRARRIPTRWLDLRPVGNAQCLFDTQ